MDRVQASFEARDWAAVRAACATDAKIEDRRRHARSRGRLRARRPLRAAARRHRRRSSGARAHPPAGDRGAASAMALLWLTEVDESGRIASGVAFDLDDRRAAQREVIARTIAGDAVAAAAMRPLLEFTEGFNDHDRARMRALLVDASSWSTTVGRAWSRSRVPTRTSTASRCCGTSRRIIQFEPAGSELTPTIRRGPRRARLRHARRRGRLRSYYIVMTIVARDRISRIEFFELDDVDAALARLRGAPPRSAAHPPKRGDAEQRPLAEAFEARDGSRGGPLRTDATVRRSPPRRPPHRRSRHARREHSADLFVGGAGVAHRARHVGRPPGPRTPALDGAHAGLAFELEDFTLKEVDAEVASSRPSCSTPTIAAPPAWSCSIAMPAAMPRTALRLRSSSSGVR